MILSKKTVIKNVGKKTIFAIVNVEKELPMQIRKLEVGAFNPIVVDLFKLDRIDLLDDTENQPEVKTFDKNELVGVGILDNVVVPNNFKPFKSLIIKYNERVLDTLDKVVLEEGEALAVRIDNQFVNTMNTINLVIKM